MTKDVLYPSLQEVAKEYVPEPAASRYIVSFRFVSSPRAPQLAGRALNSYGKEKTEAEGSNHTH